MKPQLASDSFKLRAAGINRSIVVCIWQERLNLSSMAVFNVLDHELIINVIVSIIKQYFVLKYNYISSVTSVNSYFNSAN